MRPPCQFRFFSEETLCTSGTFVSHRLYKWNFLEERRFFIFKLFFEYLVLTRKRTSLPNQKTRPENQNKTKNDKKTTKVWRQCWRVSSSLFFFVSLKPVALCFFLFLWLSVFAPFLKFLKYLLERRNAS